MSKPQITVRAERSEWHEYAIGFAFSWETVGMLKVLKEKVGWKELNFSDKAWRFSSPQVLDALRELFEVVMAASESFAAGISAAEDRDKIVRKARVLELKSAMDTDFFPNNVTKELYGYQRVGVEFFMAAKGRALLAFEPGGGKTAVVLAYAAHEGIPKTVVVCPSSAKGVWERETRKWTRLRPLRMDSKTKLSVAAWRDHDVFIINYDSFYKFEKEFSALRPGLLVADESHKLKTPSARRSKAVIAVARMSDRFIGLSGTPVLNRHQEIYTTLHMIDPKAWPSYYGFMNRYCKRRKTPWGMKYEGSQNMDELAELMAPVFLRHTKDELLPFLPKRVWQDVEVELPPHASKAYAVVASGLKEDQETGELKEINALQKLTELRQICANGKIDEAIEFVDDLAASEKVIVFCSFNEPLRQMRDFFGDRCVYLTGETSQDGRDHAQRAFQEDDGVRVFLGGLYSANEAITLTAARYTVFLDLAWTPAAMDQAASRNHRPGVEHESLMCYRLVAPGTVDEDMAEILDDKKQVFDQMFEDNDARKVMVASLLKKLRERV